MYKKFGEFYKIDNGGVPKKPQNAKIAAPTPRERRVSETVVGYTQLFKPLFGGGVS